MNCELLNFTLEVAIGVLLMASLVVGGLLWRWQVNDRRCPTGYEPMRAPLAKADPDEFGERVAKKWYYDAYRPPSAPHMATLIANELRASGWVMARPGWQLYETQNGGEDRFISNT